MEAPKDGLGNGIVYVTTLLLLAVFVLQKAMGEKFDRGMFAKGGTAAAPVEPTPAK